MGVEGGGKGHLREGEWAGKWYAGEGRGGWDQWSLTPLDLEPHVRGFLDSASTKYPSSPIVGLCPSLGKGR